MIKKDKRNLFNISICFSIVLLILILITSVNIYAQQFKRVTRESFPYSITFSFSLTSISSSSYVSYQLNPYIYAVISPISSLDIFFQLPAIFNYNKSYSVDYITEQVAKEESYLFSLSDILLGTQYTFYTRCINDIFFYVSYPIGIFPAFYKRSSIDVNLIEPQVRFSIGYRATVIYDPLLFSITPQITGYYTIPSLIDSKDKWSQQYVLSCKINLTIVFNSIISTSLSLTPNFIIPEITEFEGWTSYELYKMSFSGEVNIGIRLSENISLGLSMESILSGYLLPTYEIYVTIRG